MYFYEKINRYYENSVKIVYENLREGEIYIHLIESTNVKKGNATNSMVEFLAENKDKDIYLFASDELGIDKTILNQWYVKLGFSISNNKELMYNVTHVKLKTISE